MRCYRSAAARSRSHKAPQAMTAIDPINRNADVVKLQSIAILPNPTNSDASLLPSTTLQVVSSLLAIPRGTASTVPFVPFLLCLISADPRHSAPRHHAGQQSDNLDVRNASASAIVHETRHHGDGVPELMT